MKDKKSPIFKDVSGYGPAVNPPASNAPAMTSQSNANTLQTPTISLQTIIKASEPRNQKGNFFGKNG